LIKQKEELEKKVIKNKPVTKPPVPSSPTLKKPNSPISKLNSNFKNITVKEALTLKTPAFIKFNQIQIESIEKKNFSTPTPRQKDNKLNEIKEINEIKLNTLMLRQGDY
jgi:hypothetical protein